MKKSLKYKIIALLGLSSVLLTYNQCILNNRSIASKLRYQSDLSSKKNDSNATNNTLTSTSLSDSAIAFKDTVYKITAKRCISCHATSQTPLISSENIQTAHDSIINAYKVSFNNPENSRLYLKLKNEQHYCWGDCSSNASEMLNAINSWKSKISFSAQNSSNLKFITEESEFVKEIVDPSRNANDESVILTVQSASLKNPLAFNSAGPLSDLNFNSKNDNLNTGSAFFNFKVAKTGNYKIFIFAETSNLNSNSIFIRTNKSEYKEFTIDKTANFEWREIKNISTNSETFFNLESEKAQTLEIKQNEAGIKISKIIITDDSNFNPQTFVYTNLKGTVYLPTGHLINDFKGEISFNVEEFDANNYRITNLSYSGSKKTRIRGIKFLVNDIYNSQHSTFNKIDKTISAESTMLSDSFMIISKDKGMENDRISVAFDSIELVP